jgi:hypothetical protein
MAADDVVETIVRKRPREYVQIVNDINTLGSNGIDTKKSWHFPGPATDVQTGTDW